MMATLKFIPHLASWSCIVFVLLRAFPGKRLPVAAACILGYAAGVVGAAAVFGIFSGRTPFEIIKTATGAAFLLLWAVSAVSLYRSTGREAGSSTFEAVIEAKSFAVTAAASAAIMAGSIAAGRLPGADSGAIGFTAIALLVAAATVLTVPVFVAERLVPASFAASPAGLAAAVVSLLLFSSSSILRLDLFSPLTMKVMKFAHDFVHQFFESMLIPDHLFFNTPTWTYIGFLFGNAVGFWGALIIWFTPVILIVLALWLQPLPPVAHIREGAQRRRLIAAALTARRHRVAVPVISLLILGAAVYRSLNPTVEYWDPKPVPVQASPSGEIFIPKKGEIDLLDGKLHKYVYKQGGVEARFFVIVTPAGNLTVDLDACSICKPDGYGQAEGTVVCYYCNTLIPLETVGKPGGCNPVPMAFQAADDGVRIDALSLINTWRNTVQSTARVKGEAK